jgi:hypothetical protein
MIINPKIQVICDCDSTWNPSMSLISEGSTWSPSMSLISEGKVKAKN